MPDLTLTVPQNNQLAPVLQAIATMIPWGSPKGRYVASKASDHSIPAFEAYSKREGLLVQRVAVVGEDGQPVLKPMGNGQFHFEVQKELQEEYTAAMQELLGGEVVLRGARAITRAELGALPITVAQERILVSVGLLVDEEPA